MEAAVRAHAPDLLAYFARRVRSESDAADLLADTLLALWRRASSLPPADDDVRPWMFSFARGILLHHFRGATRRHALADRLRDALAGTANPGFADTHEYDELLRAVRALDSVDRDIIGLVHWEGFSLIEVSRILRMKQGTVRSRYHRAKTRLRKQLEDQPHASTPIGSHPG
ncbi:hypothetical protein AYL44_08040 [Microbacterium oleivorans]|uniref:Sigma-70 family RNA polymerase sigma factor n=2 Tax=Microbacterium oleivorans TaxID=273677 RepID=A0A177KAF8_9MICO|nr:hypothetical protein AYL44_08040 [Microbacterium oleivorans]